MGDLNFEQFKKLGFDSSNQWIFYDERFEKFSQFFAECITDANILTEHEVLEYNDMVKNKEFLEPKERRKEIKELERLYPGLMTNMESDVENVTQEIKLLAKEEKMYAKLIGEMRELKPKINKQLIDLEENINTHINSEKQLFPTCLEKSKQLEELQKENYRLSHEARECFTKRNDPPLFMHQLPLEQYFLKCQTFQQYFDMYLKENFKLEEFEQMDRRSDLEMQVVAKELEVLKNSFQYYTIKYIDMKSKYFGKQAMEEMLDISKFHFITLEDMEREIHELELVNSNLIVSNETIMEDLKSHVKQRTQQQIELILYENTKQKLARATERRENDKRLSKTVSDALSNAELVWIVTQLDLEKIRNRFDNSAQFNFEAQRCLRRIDAMRQLQLLQPIQKTNCEILVEKVAEQLSQHMATTVRREIKVCLHEYEKFGRLLKFSTENMHKNFYSRISDKFRQLKSTENQLTPFVYDSPVERPMFMNVHLLKSIYNSKMKRTNIDSKLRNLRIEFSKHSERMHKDPIFKSSHLLWIWFLTEPEKVLTAIEAVKNAAKNAPAILGLKITTGLKRK